MENLIATLRRTHKVYAPKRLPGGVIRYGEVESAAEVVWDEKSQFSPKEIYFPIVQTLSYFRGDECVESKASNEKIAIFARACDIAAAKRLDKIFLENGGQEDNYYKRLRDCVEFHLIECNESFENCFCVSMGVQPNFDGPNRIHIQIPQVAPERIAEIAALDYWREYDDKCISCGGCNAVCPTCSCFDTVDVIYSETSRDGERRRVWGSCMREDFATMAGGHNVRATPGARMRFKVMHKIHDFQERFGGEHMCVGCGRCIDRCPEQLSLADAIGRLNEILEKEGVSK